MSIAKALDELYRERDRLDAERTRLDEAIAALEGLDSAPSKVSISHLIHPVRGSLIGAPS